MSVKALWVIGTVCALIPYRAAAQSATDMAVLKGLAPVSALSTTTEGKAALEANYKVTGGIQSGTTKQPTLLPLPQQQQQALQDAFITGANLAVSAVTQGCRRDNAPKLTSASGTDIPREDTTW
jgi:hypothetical protein